MAETLDVLILEDPQPDPHLTGQAYAGLCLVRDTAVTGAAVVGSLLGPEDAAAYEEIGKQAIKLIDRLMARSRDLREYVAPGKK